MSLIEAEVLAEAINRETGVPAQAHQIGNGEWVVFLNATKYVWGVQDWEHLKQEKP